MDNGQSQRAAEHSQATHERDQVVDAAPDQSAPHGDRFAVAVIRGSEPGNISRT